VPLLVSICSERVAERARPAVPQPASYQSAAVGAATLDKYKNSKSISSDNFFGGEAAQADSSQLNRFQGAQSISSDAFYGNKPTRGRSPSTERTSGHPHNCVWSVDLRC